MSASVVSLPREALDYLGLEAGADVSIDLDRDKHQIVITPVDLPLSDAGVDAVFARQVAEFIERYRPALEALARE